MPRVPAHLRERALGMLQGGLRTAEVVRAINCNVRTVRRLRQRYRETGWTADRPRSGRPRATTPAQDRYIQDILLPHVVPFLQVHPDMTLQHDNATSLTASSVRDFLQDRNVCVLP